MKKHILYVFIFSSFLLKGQDAPLLNYFYNLGYSNPAYISSNDMEIDVNSTSFYNNIPIGIYGLGVYGNVKIKENIGISTMYKQTSVGKNQKINKVQFYGQYITELNFQHKLSFGLGIKLYSNIIDETRLVSDLNLATYAYTYGDVMEKQNSFQIPIGASFKNKKVELGVYYGQGVGVENVYGVYSDFLLFKTSINSYQAENYFGLSVHKENWNTKLTFYNDFEFDNYKVDLFYDYNIIDAEKSFQSFGLGLHYNWKVFDINYQLGLNNNQLGMSHQIGLKVFY